MDHVEDKRETGFILDNKKVMKHLESKNFELPELDNQDQKVLVTIPKRFSISEEPDKTIKILRWLYTIGKCGEIRRITIDHSECEFLGLSASTIMDIILLVVIEYRKRNKKYIELFGKFPKNKMAKDVLLASGLPYHLKAKHKVEYDKKKIERFETVSGECGEEKRQSGTIATDLTVYFDKCLQHQGMELKNEGKVVLATLLGEVLGNCEIHGGDNATWYTQGHYEDDENKTYGEMQLLFLNLGNTIYEGLKYESSQETKERIDYFLKRHHLLFSSEWTEEMAYTIFALQEGISRLRDKNVEGYEGRGTGTVSLIETLSVIGKCEDGQRPEMTIISGRTYIKFDGQYRMLTEEFKDDPAFGNGKKKIIAFNKENDIYKPAEGSHVKQLEENFPGTVISLRLYLDNRYIQKEKGEKRHE